MPCRIVAGGVAGGVSKSVVAPFDRLKILMMLDAEKKGVTETALKMYREGGVAGLFRSNFASVAKVLPYSAIQYGVCCFDTPSVTEWQIISHSDSQSEEFMSLICAPTDGASDAGV